MFGVYSMLSMSRAYGQFSAALWAFARIMTTCSCIVVPTNRKRDNVCLMELCVLNDHGCWSTKHNHHIQNAISVSSAVKLCGRMVKDGTNEVQLFMTTGMCSL